MNNRSDLKNIPFGKINKDEKIRTGKRKKRKEEKQNKKEKVVNGLSPYREFLKRNGAQYHPGDTESFPIIDLNSVRTVSGCAGRLESFFVLAGAIKSEYN